MKSLLQGIKARVVDDTIIEIAGSNLIIVGIVMLDDKLYAALVDPTTEDPISEVYPGWINEVRMSKDRSAFIENIPIYDDEEWEVVSEYFDKSGVFEMNRIKRWIWSHVEGQTLIPKWMYEDADKKRRKWVGTDRTPKKTFIATEDKKDISIKWKKNNDNPKKTEEKTS